MKNRAFGDLKLWITKLFGKKVNFTTSVNYWEERYKKGGNSGIGSYDQFADYKASIINLFVEDKSIESVVEFGCGDGNQLKLFRFGNYLGFDVSRTIIDHCQILFKDDETKRFKLLKDASGETADLTLSLDVIYHLIEDEAYLNHMKSLFEASKRYIIIYAWDVDGQEKDPISAHVKHRKFSKWIEQYAPEFKLIKNIMGSEGTDGKGGLPGAADFYFYEK